MVLVIVYRQPKQVDALREDKQAFLQDPHKVAFRFGFGVGVGVFTSSSSRIVNCAE
jgi:hypothetical protein